jgi:hypothetical protein
MIKEQGMGVSEKSKKEDKDIQIGNELNRRVRLLHN